MSLNVGELVGYLRLDMGDFESGMAKGTALADKLDGKEVDVKVKADTALAEAKLAALAASEKEVDHAGQGMNSTMQGTHSRMAMIIGVVATLGTLLVPLAAGAVGLGAAFGAMGAAGVLAVVGISKEMKAGTPLGAAYTAMLSTLKGDLTTLGHTAASGVLGPFQQAVADLQTKMPVLNGLIGEFSGITGRTAGVLVSGLVAGFIMLAPLARDAGMYVLTLTQRFAAMMSGPGVVTFGDYVRSVFPQVMQAVESIVGGVLHLVAALAPLGLGTLGILRVFFDLLNAIPTENLATLVQLAASVYIGFIAFKALVAPLTGLGTALKFVGVSAETAAVGVRTLTIAAAVIGAVITVATLLYTANADATRKTQQATNDLTDALRASNGVIDESIRLKVAQKLAEDGLLDAAVKAGASLSDVTSAYLGNADALARVNAAIDVAQHGTKSATDTTVQFGQALSGTTGIWDQAAAAKSKDTLVTGDAAVKLKELWTTVNGGPAVLKASETALRNEAAAKATSTTATSAYAAAQQALAVKVGTTSAALVLATAGQKTTADAAAAAAAKMYLENDAAGILKTSLDLLNGKTLNAAQAQNSFDSSLVNMGDHVNATGKKITFTTTSIGNMSSASVALRGQLNSQVTNLQAVVEANGGLSESTGKARAQMVTMRAQIINNAVAHGVDRAAVTAYIDKLLKIPKKVPPTKLDADTAAALAKVAAYQRMLNALPAYKTITITTATAGSLASTTASQVPKHAEGALIDGVGTSTSDSNVIRVSKGEFVVNAAQTAKHMALIAAINSGTQGFKDGGMPGGMPVAAINAAYDRGRPASASSATIQASIDAITALTAAWKTAIAAADAAASRAKLIADIAAAIAALHKAEAAKDKSGVSSASTSYTDAKKALAEFDAAAKVSREDAKIAAQQDALATNLKTVANKESWAFDHASAVKQLADIDRRLKAEKRYSDEWMTLAKQRESLAAQIAADAKAAADEAQQAITDAASKLNTMLDARAGILGQLSTAQGAYTSAVTAANAALATQTSQLEDARTVALATWAQLSVATTVGFAPSMSTLIGNAKTQISQFTAWMDQLALARSRGVSEAVIASLGLDQGPQSLAQLQQLNKGTVDQVAALNALVAQKTSDANAEMIREKANMLSALGQGLLAAQQVAADAIAAAQATFMASQAELTAALALVGTDQARSFTDAIAQGLVSGIPAIMAAAAAVQAAMGGAGSAGGGSLTYRTTGGTILQTKDTPYNRKVLLDDGGTILPGHAGGGWVLGSGTGTSDSNLMPASKGEFVVKAAAAARNAGLLTAINSGQQISPARPALVNVAAPIVHVYVDGKEFRGMVRVEIDQDAYAKDMSTRRKVNA